MARRSLNKEHMVPAMLDVACGHFMLLGRDARKSFSCSMHYEMAWERKETAKKWAYFY
jgi:hypothetical protein